jgi:hypothetical protein
MMIIRMGNLRSKYRHEAAQTGKLFFSCLKLVFLKHKNRYITAKSAFFMLKNNNGWFSYDKLHRKSSTQDVANRKIGSHLAPKIGKCRSNNRHLALPVGKNL